MLVKTIWTLSSYKVSLKLSITKKRIAWSLPKTNHNVSQLMISFKRFLSLLIHIYFGVKRLKYRSFWRNINFFGKLRYYYLLVRCASLFFHQNNSCMIDYWWTKFCGALQVISAQIWIPQVPVFYLTLPPRLCSVCTNP